MKVVRVSKHSDLAVLHADGLTAQEVFSLEPAIAAIGQDTLLTGFPNATAGKGMSIVKGHVTNTYPRSGVNYLDIDSQINKGNSGGPVLNSRFQVIGIARSGQKNLYGSNQLVSVQTIDTWKTGTLFSEPTTIPVVPTPLVREQHSAELSRFQRWAQRARRAKIRFVRMITRR